MTHEQNRQGKGDEHRNLTEGSELLKDAEKKDGGGAGGESPANEPKEGDEKGVE